MRRPRLGDILLSMGVIDNLQLQSALAHQKQWGTPLGKAVVEKRFCSAEQVLDALARQTGMSRIDLDQEQLDPRLATVVSRKVAEQHRLVPLRLEGAKGEVLVVALAAPGTLAALDAARAVSRKARVTGVIASDGAVDRAIARLYGNPLPVITPATTQPLQFDELQKALDLADPPVREERPVLVYGWPEISAQHLVAMLEKFSVRAKIVGVGAIQEALPEDVVVAPIPALEALVRLGNPVRARMIAAGKNPDHDLPRAHRLGAKSFLLAPLDPALLIRAVRRCRADVAPSGLEAHGAA